MASLLRLECWDCDHQRRAAVLAENASHPSANTACQPSRIHCRPACKRPSRPPSRRTCALSTAAAHHVGRGCQTHMKKRGLQRPPDFQQTCGKVECLTDLSRPRHTHLVQYCIGKSCVVGGAGLCKIAIDSRTALSDAHIILIKRAPWSGQYGCTQA